MIEVIFSEGDFTLVKESGIGVNNTPWEGLKIKSSGAAEKHVVEVRVHNSNYIPYDGTAVKYKYDSDAVEVSHGMRMATDSLADTEEYIEVLKSALAFAKRVQNYINNSEWKN